MTVADSSDFSVEAYRTPARRQAAAVLPTAQRQRQIKRLLVRYNSFKTAISFVQHFHMPVVGGMHDRGRIGALLGESRTGKSFALTWYVSQLKPIVTSKNETVRRAVYTDASMGGGYKPVILDLYGNLGLPVGRKTIPALEDDFIADVARKGIELVIIDDAQFVLNSANRKDRTSFIGFLVKLAERNVCNILLGGYEMIEGPILAVPAAAGRGFPKETIKPYSWLVEGERTDFFRLLIEIDERLPFLTRSCIADPDVGAHLYRLSGGAIGLVKRYVEAAAYIAMNENADCIDREHLKRGALPHRQLGDLFVPFVDQPDHEDPFGEHRRVEAMAAAMAHTGAADRSPRPTLGKIRQVGRGL